MGFRIVLVEPQIPPNTGNIGRLAIATRSELHLIEPLGFDLSEKAVRRAGLDYWKYVNLTTHPSLAAFEASLSQESGRQLWFFTKFATRSLYSAEFRPGDYLVFGKETTGLPDEIKQRYPEENFLRVPMPGHETVRSLNLAGTVHIALYEALRQTDFAQVQ